MKRLIVTLTMVVAFAFVLKAQKCSIYEQGQVIKFSMVTYFPMLTFSPEWAKMKPEKRMAKVEEFNKNEETGKEKPTSDGHYETTVKNINTDNGERMILSTIIGGVEYNSIAACWKDTMYFTQNSGWTVSKGDTLGYSMIGVQAIPNNLKVGDALPMYEDISIGTKSATESSVKERVFAGIKKTTSIERNTLRPDSNSPTGWTNGDWEITKTENMYNDIDVSVRTTFQMVMNTKHHMNARVDREETLNLDGKPIKAFVIESETWAKTKTGVEYETEAQQFKKSVEKMNKKIEKKVQKKFQQAGIFNEFGYMVTNLTEWFIPGIGVVKSIGYDANGFLTLKSSWDNLK